MAQALDAYVNKSVNIVTSDGRIIIGTLRGFDQSINIILDDSHERVFSASEGVEQVPLGLYIVRGDNVALIGEIDDELDKNIDFSHIRADPIRASKT
jgi:U6 snRNA-associated Sm-like protein LSm8